MKSFNIIAICIIFATISCKKVDEGIETIGTFKEQQSGYEGTITYAKDGNPAVGHPVSIQVGNTNGTVRFDPLTGNFTPIPEPNSYEKKDVTDKNGKYRLVEINKNLPLRNGHFFASVYTPSREFENYFHEYIINGKSQAQLVQNENGLVFGKIKTIDIKLHEANKLTLILYASKADYKDEFKITGSWYSPIDGQTYELYTEMAFPKPEPNTLPFIAISTEYKSKPNVPITVKIDYFREKKFISSRTITSKMDSKENTIDIF
jgi:hypothetical protein